MEELLDQLLDEQRTSWLSGNPITVQQLLDQCPELQADEEAVFSLVYGEFLIRSELVDDFDTEAFCRAHPQFESALRRQIFLHSAINRLQGSGRDTWLRSTVLIQRETPATEEPAEFRHDDRFVVQGVLGEGATGIVQCVFDRKWQQAVALKWLNRPKFRFLSRLKQEFRFLRDISHRNLVQLYELFTNDTGQYFTMELIDGEDFVRYCRRKGRSIDDESDAHWERIRGAFRQLIQGLAALHRSGVVHCDVKPSNVLVEPGGRVVLLDFGMADSSTLSTVVEHSARYLKGTVAYMAPEQLHWDSLFSPASDMYAAGVLLYQTLTGQLPFSGESKDVLASKFSSRPAAPADLVPHVPADLNEICLQLLDRRAERRPTAKELANRLAPAASYAARIDSWESAHVFAGRVAELAALRESLEQAGRGQPVIHLVSGESGIGKSYLVRRFLDEVHSDNATITFRGRCHSQEAVPFEAFDGILEALARYLRNNAIGGSHTFEAAEIDAICRMFPVLGHVPQLSPMKLDQPAARDPAEQKRQAMRGLRSLLRMIANKRRLIFFIDDLQWGDADSADILAQLLRGRDTPGLLLIGTYRSEESMESPFLREFDRLQSRSAIDATVRRTELMSLTPAESQELVTLLLPGNQACNEEFLDRIIREAGGSPLMLRQLVETFVDIGAVFGEEQVPTMIDIVRLRLGSLDDETRRLLETVAVSGQPIVDQDATRAAHIEIDPQRSLAQLRTRRFIRFLDRDTPRRRIDIYHDRIRDLILQSLDSDRVRDLHFRLAVALESAPDISPDRLATHFHCAEHDDRAFLYAKQAALLAADSLAFESAANFYALALKTGIANYEEQTQLHQLHAEALENANRPVEAAAAWLTSAKFASGTEVNRLQRLAAHQSFRTGDYLKFAEVLKKQARLRGLMFPNRMPAAFAMVAWFSLRIWLRGLHHAPPGSRVLSANERERLEVAWAGYSLGLCDALRGAALCKQHVIWSLKSGDPYHTALALSTEAILKVMADPSQLNVARKLLAQAEELEQHVSDASYSRLVRLQNIGFTDMLAGNWADAYKSLPRGISHGLDHCVGRVLEVSYMRMYHNVVRYSLGKLREIAESIPDQVDCTDFQTMPLAAVLARSFHTPIGWLVDDQVERAEDEIDRVYATVKDLMFSPHRLHHCISRMHILLYRSQWQKALEHITEAWSDIMRWGFSRIPYSRVPMHSLRATAALGVAGQSGLTPELNRMIHSDVAALRHGEVLWWAPSISLLEAQHNHLRGREDLAVSCLHVAKSGFDNQGMAFHSAVCDYALSRLLDRDTAAFMSQKSHEYFLRESVKQPQRMIGLLAPVFATNTDVLNRDEQPTVSEEAGTPT